MAIQIQSTRCEVAIVTPEAEAVTFTTDPQSELLAVDTQKDLNNACGLFTLTFAPSLDERGRTWAERIPMRSLVTIRMARPEEGDSEDPDDIVMVGITDTHASAESWRGAQPQRRVTVSGREISCVLLDANLWYHQKLENTPGVLSPQLAAAGLEGLRLQWKPDLAGTGEDPRDILEAILRFFLLGGDTTPGASAEQPVINLQFPDNDLADLLVLNSDQWTLFEEGVTVAIANNSPFIGSIWNYLHVYIDPSFQEFFSRVEQGASYLYFRGKPFKKEPVTAGTRFDDTDSVQSFLLEPSWILDMQIAQQSSAVYNVFWCAPMGMQHYLDSTGLKFEIPPEIIVDPKHPSFVGRYGLRVMDVSSPYLKSFRPMQTRPGAGETPAGQAPRPGAPSAPPPTPTTQAAGNLPLPAIDPTKLPGSARIPTEKLSATQQYYATLGAQIAREEGIPESMVPSFLGNIEQESGWNPIAKGPTNDVGIAQFTPGTARQYGLIAADGTDYRNDPVRSLHAAARLWRDLTKQLGPNPDLVAAGYNAGAGAVKAAQGVPASAAAHVAHVQRRTAGYQANRTPSAQPGQTPPQPPAPGTTAQPPTQSPRSPQAAPTPDTGEIQAIAEIATRWAKYLRAWYDMGSQLMVGTVVVRGHPQWNIGHRLTQYDDRGEREFYIEGVSHRYDLRTGHYTTAMRLTRGWYIDERPPRVAPGDAGGGEITQGPLGPLEGDVTVTLADL